MQLIKVRDNKNRPINNLDVMMKVIFGDNTPTEFVSNKRYEYGDLVFNINDEGMLKIWICNLSGKFKKCKEPNFTEWTLDYLIGSYKDIIGDNVDTQLYVTDSILLPKKDYIEEDEMAYFSVDVDNFDITKYQGLHDILEVYLRRDYSDYYIMKNEYTLKDNEIKVGISIQDMKDENNFTSEYLPLGTVVTEDVDAKYWYYEHGVKKTCDNPINMVDFDIQETNLKSIELGYKIYDLKIESVHTLVMSPQGVPRMDEIKLPEHELITSIGADSIQEVDIPFVIEPSRIDDVLHVVFNRNLQLLTITSENNYVQQVKINYTSMKESPIELFIVGNKANSEMSKFIEIGDEFGNVVDIDGEHMVEVPLNRLLQYNSYEFELYVNRVYNNSYEQIVDIETGKLYLKFTDDKFIDWDNDTFLFHMFYSISQGAGLIRTSDSHLITMDKETFRIDLSTPFVNKFQLLRMRDGAKIIPPEVTNGGKEIANITDVDMYLDVGHIMKADVFSMVFEDIDRRQMSETVTCNAESYPIMRDTKNLTIPYVDYNPSNDDFLVFKSGGVLVNTSKYYLNNDLVTFYEHEYGMFNGDYVDFKMIDRDPTIRVKSVYLTSTTDNQLEFDTGIDINKMAFSLLFTMSGMYISNDKYTINGTKITLKTSDETDQPLEMMEGDRLELISGTYTKVYTKTLYIFSRMYTTNDNQKEFTMDGDLDYNPRSDSILLFRKDGSYIGERFFSIDLENNKIVIDNGSDMPNGSYLDVLLIRNLVGYTSSVNEEDEPDENI